MYLMREPCVCKHQKHEMHLTYEVWVPRGVGGVFPVAVAVLLVPHHEL